MRNDWAMREIEIRKGETKCLLKRQSSSIPETIEFDAEPMHGEELSGTVEIRSFAIIVQKEPRHQPLQRLNQVEKKSTDTFFSIWVTPDVDTRILMKGSANMRMFWLLIAAAMVAVLASGVVIILTQ